MAGTRVKAIAALGLSSLLLSCTGTIESSSFEQPGSRNPNAPWAPGGPAGTAGNGPGSVPGGPGSAGNGLPGAGGDPGTAPPPSVVDEVVCQTPAVGPTPLRRLTHAAPILLIAGHRSQDTHPGLLVLVSSSFFYFFGLAVFARGVSPAPAGLRIRAPP